MATSYRNLALLLYPRSDLSLAVKNIEKTLSIEPNSKDNQLLNSILRNRKIKEYQDISNNINDDINQEKSLSYPIFLNRPVYSELINSLYKIKTIDLNKLKDPSFGNARGSDYKLFEDNERITEELKKDLTEIKKKVVNSYVFFHDSFFTILGGSSTIAKHNHIDPLDKFPNLSLWKQKYSLVYYLSVGDKDCRHPGTLKFYPNKHDTDPNEEILPSEGMIIIFPADRYHSVKYEGKKDRIIVGVNFYSI